MDKKPIYTALLTIVIVLAGTTLLAVYGQSGVEYTWSRYSTSVSASTIESPINRDVSTNVDVVSRGPETVYEYRYGESTILIVVVNPNVLFSYRNIHVVPWKDGFY